MRVAIYARVSTSDKDQNPETQLIPLREFCAAHGWTIIGEFVDSVSAIDLKGRVQWRDLLDRASKRHIDLILMWRVDRGFRSVLDAATTLERLRAWGVGLRSYGEPWLDTTSAFGEALYYITAAYAQLERSIIATRVKAGMERAKKQGKLLGRPRAVNGEWERVRGLILNGEMSQRKAALTLKVSRATIQRLLAQNGGALHAPQSLDQQATSPTK